ncbi:cytidine deaminase [candidate division WOR-3 bacterium]|uniref:Cytidine deaminase n=1 Tax=candidate division WOR-3 bacterium TaxID=2052148 RepID=A0A9D5QCH8_UNCW3|nr:cytidine deaminase [candidate division WOR-3 bacterium]MBD3364062.1 cytidine deaminase [candidate division WOR-3 bacterium]
MIPVEKPGSYTGAELKGNIPKGVEKRLKQAAKEVVANSYSPYSQFPVGAAVYSENGRIYSGTNVENTSYGLSICAERTAIAAAVSAGEKIIRAIAIYTPTEELTVPCGACLTTIAEFTDPVLRKGDVPILLLSKTRKRLTSLKALLPEVFKLNPKEK